MIRQWCVGAPSVICQRFNNQTLTDYRPINCSRWVPAISRSTDSRLTYGQAPWSILDRSVSTTMSVDIPCKTGDPTIVNLRDCSRGFHFCAIFCIANVIAPAERCSISRLVVQFQSGRSVWWLWRPS